jgi:DNA-binding beta-propeller fold protein YncE
MAVTRRGKLYIGSSVDGLMVLDIASEQLLPHIMPTGGPVWDIAATPDGSKLFLAMGTAGLKRLTIGTSGLVQVSDRVSPQHLAMDPQGKRLYVSYQAGGPGGRPGHDAVEIFDPEKDVSLGIVSGPPMVGGPLSVAPNGGLVLLDGLDACGTPEYDHSGCPVIPSRVFHLLRSNDGQILQSLSYPPGHGPARFLDDSRFLLAGGSISVVNARKYTVLENFDLGADEYRRIVVDPDGRRVYIGGVLPHDDILVLDPEPAECLPPQTGLSLWYSGDGTFDDAAGLTKLEKRGSVVFTPGKVGQAFFLDGRGSYLVAPWSGIYEFSSQDATLALYTKFAELHGEQTLLSRMAKGETAGMTLRKEADDRLVFQMTAPGGKPLSVKTTTPLNQGKWYQIVVTKNDDDLVIYVDGIPENALKFGGERPAAVGLENPLNLGARGTGSTAFHGWLDEVMFYNRALSADEVRALYQMRESGPCKL